MNCGSGNRLTLLRMNHQMVASVELTAALAVAAAMNKIMAFQTANEMGDFAPKNCAKFQKINYYFLHCITKTVRQ